MRIVIATDAARPQVNGVVRTLGQTARILESFGHTVDFVTPGSFRSIPCPTYPSIRLAVGAGRGVGRMIESFEPDRVHVATEGPVGHAARRWCRAHRFAFTTSFHTQFPEYIRTRAPVPLSWSYRYLRRFHGAATCTMVPTPSQRDRLAARGFANLGVWPRGVDTELFRPGPKDAIGAVRPISMFVGRVSVEKNLDAFLGLDLPGTKVIVGDGPDMERLKARHPGALFLGEKRGRDLARHFAAADVFVFPSRTDTFGLVMLEAMACGVPVAAYPVTGPIDVVEHGRTGILDEDLASAVRGALELDPAQCVASARAQSWEHATRVFESLLSRWREAPPAPVSGLRRTGCGGSTERAVQADADPGSGP